MPSRKGAPKPEYDQLTPGGEGSVTSRTTTDPVSLPDALAADTATAASASSSAASNKRLNHFIAGDSAGPPAAVAEDVEKCAGA